MAVEACTAAWLSLGSQAAERTGLRRELFRANGFAGRPFRQEVSEGISLDFLHDDARLPRRFFSARWRGYWYVPDDRLIVIHGEGDDWLNVHIDGELVLRRYPSDQMHLATRTVALAAGVHDFLIEYEQEAGSAAGHSGAGRRRRGGPRAGVAPARPESPCAARTRTSGAILRTGSYPSTRWPRPLGSSPITATGVFLAAFHGPWPVTTLDTETNSQGVAVTVDRDWINFPNDYRLLTDELTEDSEELTPLATGLVPNKWPPGSALL